MQVQTPRRLMTGWRIGQRRSRAASRTNRRSGADIAAHIMQVTALAPEDLLASGLTHTL